jgi:lipopolysaccharide export system protein LptA
MGKIGHPFIGQLLVWICVFTLFPSQLKAQVSPPLPFDPLKLLPKPTVKDTVTVERKIIEIRNADYLQQETDTINNQLKRILEGNVRLLHDGALMTCEKATLFPESNYLEAERKVIIRKSDSIEIRSGFLKYYGDSKYAILEKEVVLKDKTSVLEAPKMDYDVGTDIGNFYEGGKLTTDSSVLTSKTGTYFQKNKVAVFRQDVVLVHPDYTMYSDSMRYDTKTKIAWFISPTIIVSKEDTIFTSSGFFDTQNNKANFGKRPLVKKGQENTLQADVLEYDKATGTGYAQGSVVSKNTKDRATLLANDLFYVDSNSYVRAVKDPLMIQEDEKDTLYLSSDTLISYKIAITDTLGEVTDSIKIFYGYRNVKTIQDKMSGICDSIYFSGQDSIFRMFYDPVIWMDSTQMTADTILMYMKDKKVVKIELLQNALIIQENDPLVYNQIKGRTIMGILESNKLKKVYVDGNAECIYFVQDDSSAYLGANKSQSATIEADFNSDEKIERIKLDIQPEATFTPIQMIEWGKFKLDGFHWQWNKKPKDKWDVIRDSTQYLNYIKEYYSDDPETTGTMDTQEDNENDLPASEKLQPDVEPTIETLDKIQEDIPQEGKVTPIQKPNKKEKIRDN